MSSSNPPPADDDWGTASTPWQPRQQPSPQQQWPPQPPQPPHQQWPVAPPTKVQSRLIPAILVTLLCFVPTGIVAIIYAVQVSAKLQAGDLTGATKASNNAKTWVIVSVVAALIFWFIVFANMEMVY
jgi:hypothetical protein